MKNTIKMSLVAALAVAGLSTTASAGSLEEAIKGVSVSGKVEVEYDYTDNGTNGAAATYNGWDYDFDVTVKVPVNDNFTAVLAAQADRNEDASGAAAVNSEIIDMTKIYFQYANGPVTAMAGKMGMAGAPWFDDERANGLVAIYNAGVAAIAAGHFTDNNGHAVITAQDVSAAAVIAGNIADSGINASLWYADVSNVADSYSLNVNGKIADMVNFDIRHTETDFDAVGDVSLTKAVLSADIEAINVRLGYGTTNDNTNAGFVADTHTVNLEAIGGDNDAAVTFGLEQLNIADLNDADVFLIGAGTTFGALSLNIDYIDGETGNTDFDEVLLQADYQVSKNFKIGSHYSTAEVGAANSTDNAAVSLEYKF